MTIWCVCLTMTTHCELLQITTTAVDPDDLTKLFSALYRVFTVPTKFSEVCVCHCVIGVCIIRVLCCRLVGIIKGWMTKSIR